MAGTTLGFLKFVLGFDSVAFKKGMTQSERDLVTLQKKFQSVGKSMTDIGAKLTIGITAPLAGFAAKGIKEAQETAAAMAQVNAALASMGPVAGRTAKQLEQAANAFEGSSLYEGDQILKEVTANLLTFGNISGKAFDQAQQAAINLATRLGGDLQGAALLVGKALNDPIKGIGALGKAGIQFSVEQKAAIKAMAETGNVAGAQAILLAEFQKQFGGAAQAAQNADPFNKLSDAFNSMAESLGTILLPILTRAADFLAGLATRFQALSPETQKWVAIVAGIAAVAGPVLIVLGSTVTAIGALAPLVTGLSAAWGALKVVLLATRIAAVATLPALTPFLIPLGAIALAVGGVYLAFKNWDRIKAFVISTYTTIKSYMVDKLNAVWSAVKAKVEAVTGFFKTMWDKVVGHSYVPDMVTAIGVEMAKLDALMVAPAKATTDKVALAFAALQQRVSGLLAELYPEQARQNQFNKDLADLDAYAAKAGLSVGQLAEAVERLKVARGLVKIDTEDLTGAGDSGPMEAFGSFGTALGKFRDETKLTTDQVIENFGQMAAGAIGSVKDMVATFKSGDILGGIRSFLETVLSVVQALSKIGVIKGAPAGGNYGGARAAGGPVVPGKSYLVGENGPEFVTPRRRGFVHPNGASSGQQRITIVPSRYFDAVVDQRASGVAAPMAGQAAVMGAAGAEARSFRRARRSIP